MNYKIFIAACAAALVILAAAVCFSGPEGQEAASAVNIAENNQYTVQFDSRGGSEVMQQTSLYNYYISLPSDAEKHGYILTEWNTSPDGKGVGYQPGSLYLVQGNTTLYASWTSADKYYDSTIASEAAAGTEYVFLPYTGDSQISAAACIRDGFSGGEKCCRDWRMFYRYDWSVNSFTSELNGTAASWLEYTLIKTGGSGKTYITGIEFRGVPTAAGVYSAEFTGKESGTAVICYKWYITVTDASCGRYQVSFDLNSGAGSGIPSRSAQYNNLITLPGYGHALPSRTGYALAGWQDANGAVWPLGSKYPVSSNTIMKAYWTGNANVVIFDVSGSFASSGSSAYAVYTGSSVKMPDHSVLTKTGYTLLGWYESVNRDLIYNKNYELPSVNGDRLFAAYFVPDGTEVCSVTYDANGGVCASVQSQQTEAGKYAVLPAIGYNKDNATLVSWNTKADGSGTSYAPGSAVKVSGNMSLYAQWHEELSADEKTYYDIYFALNGGTGNISRQQVLAGTAASKPAVDPVKAGSVFLGWSLSGRDSDLYDFSVPVKSGITLTAVWTSHFTLKISEQKITISFAYGDAWKHIVDWGDGSSPEEIFDGRSSVTSHKMSGGFYSYVSVETIFSDNTAVKSSRSYYIPAAGEEDKVTVAFQAEYGNGMQEYTIVKGSVITLPGNGFSRDGFTLAGWGLNQQENMTHKAGEQYTAESDTVFFAIWEEDSRDAGLFLLLAAGGISAAAAAVFLKTRSRRVLAVFAAATAAAFAGGML